VSASRVLVNSDWRDRAACRDAEIDLFFPVGDPSAPGNVLQAERAKRVCSACEVRRDCLSFAVDAAEGWGIWGGTTEDERHAARRHLTRGAA
jgi:WhiB family redox-sensing transcriptional regulator